jgi:hypothetical protein
MVLMIFHPPCGGAGSHSDRADDLDPGRNVKTWELNKVQPGGQVRKDVCFGGGEKGQRDDAHSFLSIVPTMFKAHPGSADKLSLTKEPIDEERPGLPKEVKQQAHEDKAAK